MTKPRTAESAEKAVGNATNQVIQDGGIPNKDALWDVTEMALDGVPKGRMVQRLKQERSEPYQPTSGWTLGRRGRT